MKQILAIAFALISFTGTAQDKKQSDTLVVPVGKYKYIKIGDKVYKITTQIELSEPKPWEPKELGPWLNPNVILYGIRDTIIHLPLKVPKYGGI